MNTFVLVIGCWLALEAGLLAYKCLTGELGQRTISGMAGSAVICAGLAVWAFVLLATQQ